MNEKTTEEGDWGSLMRAAQAGDKGEYHRLLTGICPALRGFIFNKIGDGFENEDVLQEILIAIHRSGHTFNTDRSFKNWMFAIADHKVADYLRGLYRRGRLSDKIRGEPILPLMNEPVTFEEGRGESLEGLLNALTEKQRQVVRMLKIDEMSIKEVSAKLEMSESAVKVTAHRAYKVLVENGRGLKQS